MLRLRRRSFTFRVRLLRSFYYAFAGIAYLFRTQRNARIELAVAVLVLLAAAWLRVSRLELAVLVLTCAAVLILEAMNTALEAAVDLASPKLHPVARIAKDVSAAAVLLGAIASAVIGLLLLGPPLWHRLFP